MNDEDRREIARQMRKEANQYTNKGDYANAIRLADEAIKLDPTNVRTLRIRSFCLAKLGKLEPALADLDKALETNPNSPLDIHNKILALRGMGRIREADELLLKTNERIPRFEDWMTNPTDSEEIIKNKKEQQTWLQRMGNAIFPSFFNLNQHASSKAKDDSISPQIVENSVVSQSSEGVLRKRVTHAHHNVTQTSS